MTDFSELIQPDNGQDAVDISLVENGLLHNPQKFGLPWRRSLSRARLQAMRC